MTSSKYALIQQASIGPLDTLDQLYFCFYQSLTFFEGIIFIILYHVFMVILQPYSHSRQLSIC